MEKHICEMFEETSGIVSLVFLLTKLKNDDVKAEVISDVNDLRLRSKEPFAALRADHLRLDTNGTFGETDSYLNGIGDCLLLKPRVYRRLLAGTTNDFFDALAEINGDVILTNYDEEEDEWRWHVKDNS